MNVFAECSVAGFAHVTSSFKETDLQIVILVHSKPGYLLKFAL